MQSTALFEKEVSDLRTENKKEKRKRARSTRQIPSEEGLLDLEPSTLIAQSEQVVLAPIPREAGPAQTPSQPL
ncbi:hypothetical protein PENANT_c170G05277 [Penicillium antarcticum]|uniref:Uncharacterized protein n=1 Tax=Penicillium antarcticum TaxID=416450 RepID=A0A1V6PCB9_9EURO|nr:hypothetical protein PENANT_c170G05277 [Penicillium antarcticum]